MIANLVSQLASSSAFLAIMQSSIQLSVVSIDLVEADGKLDSTIFAEFDDESAIASYSEILDSYVDELREQLLRCESNQKLLEVDNFQNRLDQIVFVTSCNMSSIVLEDVSFRVYPLEIVCQNVLDFELGSGTLDIPIHTFAISGEICDVDTSGATD